jgi:hypothetical protein
MRKTFVARPRLAAPPLPPLLQALEVRAPVARIDPSAAVVAARRLNRAAGVIAVSVLVHSAVEHYRGEFHNKVMFTPPVLGALSLLVSAHGHNDRRPVRHGGRDAVYASAALAGVAGLGFHLYNVGKKPGGYSWQNLFYSAPIGAPLALVLSGAMGFLSERVRDTTPGDAPTIGGLSAGRVVGAATSVGLLGTTAEAGMLHFRGAFHDPFMYLPVTIPPLAAALIGNASVGRTERRPLTKAFLRFTAALGFVGAGFTPMAFRATWAAGATGPRTC